jgi:hypothetical protein
MLDIAESYPGWLAHSAQFIGSLRKLKKARKKAVW